MICSWVRGAFVFRVAANMFSYCSHGWVVAVASLVAVDGGWWLVGGNIFSYGSHGWAGAVASLVIVYGRWSLSRWIYSTAVEDHDGVTLAVNIDGTIALIVVAASQVAVNSLQSPARRYRRLFCLADRCCYTDVDGCLRCRGGFAGAVDIRLWLSWGQSCACYTARYGRCIVHAETAISAMTACFAGCGGYGAMVDGLTMWSRLIPHIYIC